MQRGELSLLQTTASLSLRTVRREARSTLDLEAERRANPDIKNSPLDPGQMIFYDFICINELY